MQALRGVEPTRTNGPKSFMWKGVAPRSNLSSDIRGGFSRGVPPLPIPNRAVKPARADGTDTPVGRVGRRRTSGSPGIITMPGLLFFAYMSHTPVMPSTGLCTPRRREGTDVSPDVSCGTVSHYQPNFPFPELYRRTLFRVPIPLLRLFCTL